jgi:hypothetical protein
LNNWPIHKFCEVVHVIFSNCSHSRTKIRRLYHISARNSKLGESISELGAQFTRFSPDVLQITVHNRDFVIVDHCRAPHPTLQWFQELTGCWWYIMNLSDQFLKFYMYLCAVLFCDGFVIGKPTSFSVLGSFSISYFRSG